MSILPPGFPNNETVSWMRKLRYQRPIAFWVILAVFFAVMISSIIDAQHNGGSLIPRPTPGISGLPWRNPNNSCGPIAGCNPATNSSPGLGYGYP